MSIYGNEDDIYDGPDTDENYNPDDYFSDPGGRSALRASTDDKCPSCKRKVGKTWLHCAHCGGKLNPRNLPCGSCGTRNVLTPADKARGYQCDACADHAEGIGPNGRGEY
jgi:hypothetical protein